jgi:hypothetical protein
MKRILILGLVALFVSGIALAAPVAAKKTAMPEKPQAPAELRQLDYFAGTWDCTGEDFPSQFPGPTGKTTGTAKSAWELDNQWLGLNYTEGPKNGFAVKIHLGWDPGSNKFVMGSVNNAGGYSVESSAGWEGDKLTFTGPNHFGPATVNGREVFTKMGDKHLTHSFEIDEKETWKKLSEHDCHKK